MTIGTGIPALGRIALCATLFGLAGCPADEGEDDGAGTEVTLTTAMTGPTTNPGDSSESGSETAPVEVDYVTDIQPIWAANCTAGCHEPGGIYGNVAMNQIDLTSAMSYMSLTTIDPTYSVATTFIEPGNAAESFLIEALRRPPGSFVRQMPLVLDTSTDPPLGVGNKDGTSTIPLSEETIALVEAWIDAGANP